MIVLQTSRGGKTIFVITDTGNPVLWINNTSFPVFNFLNYFVWLRITDEGSVPEMRILSILKIESDIFMVYTS